MTILGLLLICGIIGAIFNPKKDNTSQSQSIQTSAVSQPSSDTAQQAADSSQFSKASDSAPAPGSAQVAPSYDEITANHKSMTGAQWDHFRASLIGMRASDWQGWVRSVDKRWINNNYQMQIDMDRPGSDCEMGVAEILMDVSEATALKFNKCESIQFSGTIKDVSCVFDYCVLTLEP